MQSQDYAKDEFIMWEGVTLTDILSMSALNISFIFNNNLKGNKIIFIAFMIP